jgi:hypothetical protein
MRIALVLVVTVLLNAGVIVVDSHDDLVPGSVVVATVGVAAQPSRFKEEIGPRKMSPP